MQVLIYGYSSLTRMLIPELLTVKDLQITVLDEDLNQLQLLSREPRVEIIWISEPLMQNYWQEAAVGRAEVFMALSQDDNKNALLSQMAHHNFNVPEVICYLEGRHLQNLYQGLGLRVVGPELPLAQNLRQIIQG